MADVLSRPASGESDISGGSKQSGDDAQIAPSLPPESTASSRGMSVRIKVNELCRWLTWMACYSMGGVTLWVCY